MRRRYSSEEGWRWIEGWAEPHFACSRQFRRPLRPRLRLPRPPTPKVGDAFGLIEALVRREARPLRGIARPVQDAVHAGQLGAAATAPGWTQPPAASPASSR